MNEEEDFSGLPAFTYFVDRRCRDLQQMLRIIPEYEELRVVRQMWGDNWKFQPYIIQDEDKKNLIILEPEILDVLSDYELRSFIDVEMKLIENHEDTFWLLIATIILTSTTIFSPIMSMLLFPRIEFLFLVAFASVFAIFPLIVGIVYHRKRKSWIATKRHIDLVAAQENTAFLSALHKLASLPDLVENLDSGKRLRYIERALSGSNS